ncbi:MAG: hypothetical protein ACT4NL_15275 [Pseudomarimonas sp.]
MLLIRFCLLLMLAPAAAAQTASSNAIPSAEADLAWLNRYLETNAASRKPIRPSSGPGIPFAELRQKIGTPLRVTLADGGSRFGVLVEANARSAKLKVRVGAGNYLFGFEPEQVTQIEER